ncbi:shikimate dehydrogenase [Bifidobacterium ramosum]|uniref:Shikimate dehydrogenase n=1 Tax=Bifidobacterium ramosum TaxID=1798158 RepID=A0A6L4X2P2_9BIFI|nr:shikimate dehydrogenase [Bifidobacterium ramosum]KAB8289271.1 shikimate dehydrogenase [Bifidobacterium ramosum]NEG70977.1 shikimate dehydrogenase [Bifidobacterium ramosum]
MTQINHRCAVLGKPIAHSLSPVLHMAAYRALGLDDWRYDRHEVGEHDLDGFLQGLDPTWHGLSLTMPLKKTIQPYGTPKDVWAKSLKVANTAVFDWTHAADHDGKPAIDLYNTDVPGIIYAFQHACDAAGGPSLEERSLRRATVIGNGNTAASAACAISVMLAASAGEDEPGKGDLTVVARHPRKNPDIPRIVAEEDGATLHEVGLEQAVESLRGADIAVSTIPGHAADAIAETIETDDSFFPHGILLDVVYDPRPSALIRAWRDKGGVAIGGEEMLLYQAILQVRLMTGSWGAAALHGGDWMKTLEAPMRAALEEAL